MPTSTDVSVDTAGTAAQYNNLRKDVLRGLAMAGSNKTISSGAITVSPGSGEGFYLVDTEGAASTDDLDTINGGSNGDIINLAIVNAARVVTLKNGTGNIILPSDVVLTATSIIVALRYNGSNWISVGSVGAPQVYPLLYGGI